MAEIRNGASSPFTVGVALDGSGWHPAAWREPLSGVERLFTANYWKELVVRAEDAGIDYVTIEDSLQLPGNGPFDQQVPPRPRADRVAARLDALLVASWVAPHTNRIGLIPTVTTTHTEPFHVATALQTLDHISGGRAAWQLRFSAGAAEAAAFGRRAAPKVNVARVLAGKEDEGLSELITESAEAAEVARRLWDSWEDHAEIREVSTGRFLDADRLHHIEFVGEHFSVVGPSIVPRSPQGQLPITLLAHSPQIFALAAKSADVVFITPENQATNAGASRGKRVVEIVAEVREAEQREDREAQGFAPLHIVADLVVALDTDAEPATERLRRLDTLAGEPFVSDAFIVAGSAGEVADVIVAWHEAGVSGVRLRPLTLPTDLTEISDRLLPLLRQRIHGLQDDESKRDLRRRFGLSAARNRYETNRFGAVTADAATASAAPAVAVREDQPA